MSNFNPYAPPQANIEASSFGQHASGTPVPWSVGEVISLSWDLVKKHWPALVFGPVIAQILAAIPGQLGGVLGAIGGLSEDVTLLISLPLTIVGMILGFWLQGGTMKMFLSAARGGTPQLSDIFSGGAFTGRLVLTSLLIGLAVMGGMLLLIVGAFIAGLGLLLAPYYVVDAGMRPMEAFRESWRSMKGNKGQVFELGLAFFGLALLGLLACVVGVFVVAAMGHAAVAIVFTRISGRTAPDPA
jgi:uncharacterized membrane protein